MKRRWFNFRPLCIVFMFLLLGTLFAFFVGIHIVWSIIILVIMAIVSLIIAIIKKRVTYFILPMLCLIIGFSAYKISVTNFNKRIEVAPQIVSARIYQTSTPIDGRMVVYADSVKFDGKKAKTNLVIYIYDNSSIFKDIEIGSVIECEPFGFYKTDILNKDIPNSYYFNKNIKYSVLTSKVKYIKTDKTFAEIIKTKIKDNLSNGLTNENTEIAYSTLFGDKTELNSNIKEAFQLSGIAHILAVSGLHISIIVAILYRLLKLCKVKGWARFGILAVILLFYAYICNFSVSVVRASIMSLLLMLAPLVKKQYDPLNALSLAGIVIFMINPLCVFDISFLMSFSCVLGILFICKPISKFLTSLRLPKFIADIVAVCSSTCISLIFIQAYFFGRINLVSIFANLLLIPIFTFAFEIIFCFAFLSLIIPYLTYLLMPINYIFNFISLAAIFISNLPYSNFSTKQFNYLLIVLYFFLLMILGRICTANKKEKVAITLPITGLMLAFIV